MKRSKVNSHFAELLKKAGAKEKTGAPPKKGDAPAFIQTLANVVSFLFTPLSIISKLFTS